MIEKAGFNNPIKKNSTERLILIIFQMSFIIISIETTTGKLTILVWRDISKKILFLIFVSVIFEDSKFKCRSIFVE